MWEPSITWTSMYPEALTGGSQIVSYKKVTEMSQLHCFQPRIELGTCSTGEPACDSLTVGDPETDTLIDQLSIVTHGEYTALLSSAPLIWLKYDTFTVKRCLNHAINNPA